MTGASFLSPTLIETVETLDSPFESATWIVSVKVFSSSKSIFCWGDEQHGQVSQTPTTSTGDGYIFISDI